MAEIAESGDRNQIHHTENSNQAQNDLLPWKHSVIQCMIYLVVCHGCNSDVDNRCLPKQQNVLRIIAGLFSSLVAKFQPN